MKRSLLPILACPEDKAPLQLTGTVVGDDQEVMEGTLTCSSCGFAYPIEEGIPNLLPQAMHVDGVNDAA